MGTAWGAIICSHETAASSTPNSHVAPINKPQWADAQTQSLSCQPRHRSFQIKVPHKASLVGLYKDAVKSQNLDPQNARAQGQLWRAYYRKGSRTPKPAASTAEPMQMATTEAMLDSFEQSPE